MVLACLLTSNLVRLPPVSEHVWDEARNPANFECGRSVHMESTSHEIGDESCIHFTTSGLPVASTETQAVKFSSEEQQVEPEISGVYAACVNDMH